MAEDFLKERQQEEQKLQEVIEIAQNNLDHARESILKMDEDIAELHANLDMENKAELVLWNDATIRARQMKREFDRYEKARKKPYFGRIDFVDPKVKHHETYYIGRVGIAKSPSEPVVIDWRAPIASVYYENNLGPCRYTVSSEGTFEIDLKKKRTYTIEGDKLKEYFDSDVVANDDLLTSYLAKNKKAVLGEIIATIQKEQNLIIRRSPKTNMIVQGCAGSGKTTVAMHRISYILYSYEDEFRPEDFYIVGSNKILLNYITSVLPDLDVYGIRQLTMEELFIRLLYEDWDKLKYTVRKLDKQDEIQCVKGTREWFLDLSKFCDQYERTIISREEVRLEKTGVLLVGPNLIDTFCTEHPDMSMQQKIGMLNEILYSKYENEVQGRHVSFTAAERKHLDKKYMEYYGKDQWKGSLFELYHDFLLLQAGKEKLQMPQDETAFDVYDLAALAYLYKRIKEVDPIREASHVVIDEAQDFGMMAYECLHYCLRNCTYTIMGDTSQNIHFGYGLNDWEDLRKLILTGTYDSFGVLKKSYRNTVEISNFATEILRHGDFPIYPVEPIVRHGDEVLVKECQDEQELLISTVVTVRQWLGNGYDTIAIVCRDEEKSKAVWEQLKDHLDVADGTREDAEFGNGVMVLPVASTKGLEFDAVLLFNPTEESYPAEDKYVKLLYVAATRALHQCTVLYQGNLTKLIATKAPEGKHQNELFAPTLTKAKEYEKASYTEKELEEMQRIEGHKDMRERESIGPKRIVVASPKKEEKAFNVKELQEYRDVAAGKKTYPATVKAQSGKIKAGGFETESSSDKRNPSPYEYGSMPTDSNALKPKGHTKGNYAVRWIKKDKRYIEFVSNAGVLRLTPIAPELVRVTFKSGQMSAVHDNYWSIQPKTPVKYTVKENRDMVDLVTEKMIVRVEKKNGAVRFLKPDKTIVLSEKLSEPRQMEANENWVYFDWDKKEKIKSKGILKGDWKLLTGKAAYISHGGKSLRMPMLQSDKGYEIFMACESTVLCCAIPMYGPYIYSADTDQVDYYFAMSMDEEVLKPYL
ncbi:MAG: DUF4968 domain-containing protein [Agathobacter sp.]|nr:DUF4968 domain-containing protein [Agathobacter sp.]